MLKNLPPHWNANVAAKSRSFQRNEVLKPPMNFGVAEPNSWRVASE
ncbi:MAG: hypothetical protein ACLR8Y_05805 [Alistipes indistinctus]